MTYKSFLFDGSWEMDYRETEYQSEELPVFNGYTIENAVPGYWEDMADKFFNAPFFEKLKINPAFGSQRYPIATTAPDMALPNYLGNFFYRRKFDCPFEDKNLFIHFAGVQNTVRLWLNGTYLGCHAGYSTPFDFEIPTGLLKEKDNTIVLSVSNLPMAGYDGRLISGLTNRAANEYTGGICGSVELRIKTSALTDGYCVVSKDCKRVDIKLTMDYNAPVTWELLDGESVIKTGTSNGDFTISAEGLINWTPENPKLYTIRVCCEGQSLDIPFGIRRLIADGQKFRLSGKPYFLRGVCEHCYFPQTIHPNHDREYYRSIVKNLKELGFNFIRFHTYIPEEEYMQAADELGMLLHVESPNNTTFEEWKQIVKFCRKHPSVVIYCCGNELLVDEPFIAHLKKCAAEVHKGTDALFSPMSALRGVEYCWDKSNLGEDSVLQTPFPHNHQRLKELGKFCDMYSSYANELLSYESLKADPKVIDSWGEVYQKPRVSHEICIDGTYTDLSLEERYKNLPAGKTAMLSSIRDHLKEKGVLAKARTYFENSSQWQRRVRKYCFEAIRRCNNMAGFDFLGPIDTHWHTFGYDVGMMNEFYELKPGETVKNVLMYNSETVLLNDLGLKVNFESGEHLKGGILVSHYGEDDLTDAVLTVKLVAGTDIIYEKILKTDTIKNGEVSKLFDMDIELPDADTPKMMKLCASLYCGDTFAENEWEMYLFPKADDTDTCDLVVSEGMTDAELKQHLSNGKNVVLFGAEPFKALDTTFRIGLAGRCSGNLATVIYNHPALKDLPHDGFCSWQFSSLIEGGKAVCFENDDVPFNPIVEVVSTHKYVIRQSSLFEFKALNGKLLVCSMNFKADDAAVKWLKSKLLAYANSSLFNLCDYLDEEGLNKLLYSDIKSAEANTNFAFNLNDKASQKVEE
ncbi:MAG: beta galactosidase jelly roll domain-containing protein [Clostridia bacterium]|nr:beta galactosidase jelly roll domain-containing protein [Clostridia bacterium]